MSQNRGFTLIELLVSLAVVVILAAMILGGVTAVKTSVNGAKCLANLKTIGGAMRGYISDNNGYLPPHNNYAFFETNGLERMRKARWHWMAHLASYLGSPNAEGPMSSVFECPADPQVKTWPNPRPYIPASPSDKSHALCSYGYNYYHLTTANSWWPRPEGWVANANVIANPSTLILVADGREVGGDPIINPYSAPNWPSFRHAGRFNAVFLDGHVAPMEKQAASQTQKYWIGK